MDEMENNTLDLEFKRYLQILRPYIAQLADDDVINVCNAWVDKLVACEDTEKLQRNKFVFTLCYQLARGALEEPFTKLPPSGSLTCITESITSEESTEVEYCVVNPDNADTEVILDDREELLIATDCHSQACFASSSSKSSNQLNGRETDMSLKCPQTRYFVDYDTSCVFESRANNLIRKLRDIKIQNALLQNELLALREESASYRNNTFMSDDNSVKVDAATSAVLLKSDSSSTLKSLKLRLQDVQDSRNCLIKKISELQDVINNFEENKKHDIEEISLNHKLEIINVKEAVRQEIKTSYEKKMEELKQEYELKIDSLKNKSSCDIEMITSAKNDIIEEKNKIIASMELEISKLAHSEDSIKLKAEQLEKKLHRMEKNKAKRRRAYEARVAQVCREKHLAECSLQLQMVRQRAQVVNEVTDESRAELVAAVDRLEARYREIVRGVQTAAAHRNMQQQIALQSILQATEANNSSGGQFPKTIRAPVARGSKVGNVCGASVDASGYCLDGERMGELLERVYLPQRDATL